MTTLFLALMICILAWLAALLLNKDIAEKNFSQNDSATIKRNFFFEATAITIKQAAGTVATFFFCYILGSLVRGEVHAYNSSGGDGFAAPLFPSHRAEYDLIGNIVVIAFPLIAAILSSRYAVQKLNLSNKIYASSLLILFSISPLYLIILAVFYW